MLRHRNRWMTLPRKILDSGCQGAHIPPSRWSNPLVHSASVRFSKENFPKMLKVVESINTITTKYDATPGQIALAWLLAQGPDIIPIPGTRSPKVGVLSSKQSKLC